MAFVDLLERRRAERPSDPFLHANGRTWTAADLGERAAACAAAFASAGVGRGDHVALMLGNSADFVACLFAIARLGAVAVTLNPALRGNTLAYVLDHSDAQLLIVESGAAAGAGEAIPASGR